MDFVERNQIPFSPHLQENVRRPVRKKKMGQQPSSAHSHNGSGDPGITKEELDMLLEITSYTSNEIIHLRSQFYKDCPTGVISKTTFDIAAGMFGFSDSATRNMLFNIFDTNSNGMVTFFEFAHAMSVMTRGVNEDKITFAFDTLDVERQGFLTYDNVLPLIDSMEATLGPLVSYMNNTESGSGQSLTPVQVCDRMFGSVRRLTRPMFSDFVNRNPSVMRGLALSK